MSNGNRENAPQARLVGMRTTPLEILKRTGKLLQGPTRTLLNMQLSSWVNDALPEILWTALLFGTLPRTEALAHLRRVLVKVRDNKEVLAESSLEHSRLAQFDQDQFNLFFAELCSDEAAKAALSPLLLLQRLPDRALWEKVLGKPKDDAAHGLANAVALSFDHQSEAATDCRWFKIMTMIEAGRMQFDLKLQGRLDAIVDYPNRGDMRSVRPSIRAMEMMTRPGASKNEVKSPWCDDFWAECWEQTECFPLNPDEKAKVLDGQSLIDQVVDLEEKLSGHFTSTVETTNIDPKHDAAFGLTLYIVHLLFFCLKSSVGQTVQGRLLLRCVVETYITLAFLVAKDDPTIWLQYRNYGAGQAKLSLLKMNAQNEVPSFISRELLEQLANEDMWHEHQDIKLGAWADKNLRKMAEDAGVKALYDRHYDALSGYGHANWIGLSHSLFGLCLNPLHRFHRIPIPPRMFVDDALPDVIAICNLALDQLASLYPPFKKRLRIDKA